MDDGIVYSSNKYRETEGIKVNRSHAVAYSITTVRTAWLKTHYPVEFYTSNIMHELNNQEKVTALIEEANSNGIRILQPDVNESNSSFTIINNNTIRFGLSGIMSVGENAALSIIDERNKYGKFISITDLIIRTNIRSNVLINMAKAGCFDSMYPRPVVMSKLDDNTYWLDSLHEMINSVKVRNLTQFPRDIEWLEFPQEIMYTKNDIMVSEKETIGLWLSSNPFKLQEKWINEYLSEKKKAVKNMPRFAGMIKEIFKFKTGKGCSLRIAKKDGSSAVGVMFGYTWKTYSDEIDSYLHKIIGYEGRLEDTDEDAEEEKVFISKITELQTDSEEHIMHVLDSNTIFQMKHGINNLIMFSGCKVLVR